MKNKLNKTLKISSIIFALALFFTSCQKDDQSILDESQLEQKTPLILNQKISFNQAQHFNQIQSKINTIKKKINHLNSQNRTDNEDIEILTEEVLYITYEDTHTYSFKVLRQQPQALVENIVLHYDIKTEKYNEYLVQYNIAAEKFVSLYQGDFLQNSENVKITPLENGFFEDNSQSRGCYNSCETIFVACGSGQHNSGNVSTWGNCTSNSLPSAYQSCTTVCDGIYVDNGPEGDQDGGPTSGGGGITTIPTIVTNPLPTEPCSQNGGIGITNSNGNCIEDLQEYMTWLNEFEILPNSPCGLNHDCVQSIRTMADGLRRFHGVEGELMATYFENLISDFSSFNIGELQVFYDTAKSITNEYNRRKNIAIVGAFYEGITPILEIALFEVGGPVALKLLGKIPLPWVLQGARLNNMVKKIGLLGTQGSGNSIRIVTVNSAPYSKALDLFKSVTRNANSVNIYPNGTRIANMGGGNLIKFRPSSASGSNYPATIDLDFPSIWSSVRSVKFQ